MKVLHQILAPCSVELFLAEYWNQKAIHITTDHAQKFRSFFSWSMLNYLLNYHRLTETDLRFSKEGQSLPATFDRQSWSERLRQGATLIVDGVHHRVPSVAQLAANLREDLGFETHVNLYCSPANHQGFDCHYDTHDVFILQIDGRKKWFVYEETVPHPVADMPSSKEAQPTDPPYLECVLHAGDLLYIPRGHWHYAIAHEQPSLHLTVGVECQTGLDWLRWFMHDVLQDDPVWRQSLPATVNNNTNALEQRVSQLREHLITALGTPDFLQKYVQTLSYIDYPQLPVNLPTQMGTDIFPALFMTRFAWSKLHPIHIQRIDENHYQMQIGAKQIDLKGIPATLAENLPKQTDFSLLDVANWAPDLDLEADIEPLLRSLIFAGVLQVVAHD